jgi:hypothetical protein
MRLYPYYLNFNFVYYIYSNVHFLIEEILFWVE